MKNMTRLLCTLMFGLLLASSGTTYANAFCGTIRASATGSSNLDALNAANNIGLVEVRRLEQRYGNRVNYELAKPNCYGAGPVRCTITQAYCVSGVASGGVKPRWPKCNGPNEMIAPNDGCNCKPGFVRFSGVCEPDPKQSAACKAAKSACARDNKSACQRIESECNLN